MRTLISVHLAHGHADMGMIPRTQSEQRAMYRSARDYLVGTDPFKRYHDHDGAMPQEEKDERPNQDV